VDSYEQIWSGIPSVVSSSNPAVETDDVDVIRAFYALFNILLGLGSLHASLTYNAPHGKSTNSDVGRYYDRAENLISGKAMSHNSLLSVQVYILIAQYLQTTGEVNKCWVAVGTAIRLAQGLGIHLDHPSESQAQRQERKRTWAYCIQSDR
jgi:hypothetical protein